MRSFGSWWIIQRAATSFPEREGFASYGGDGLAWECAEAQG